MPDSTELVHRAIDMSDAEDYTGALNLLARAITVDPSNAQAYFERGIVLMNLNRDADAIPDFDRALAIKPEFPGARDWRARALATLGDHQGAAEDRFNELQSHPDGPHHGMGVCPQDWADCAAAFIKAGNHQKARELLEDYFDNYAGKVTSYVHFETAPIRILAKLLMQSGDSVRGCEFAQRAYSSDHQCPADVLAYALALEASGNLARSREICAEAIEINDQMPGVKELHARLVE